MSASNAMENSLLLLLFNNTDIANVGDAAGLQNSAAAGSFFVALHTADPGEAGDQTTSETAYTNYARVGVARSGAGWTVSGTAPTQAANAAAVTFPACGASGSTVTHFSVGLITSGASVIVASGILTASLIINSGITPSFAIGALTVTLD
jgi:hypothetical protein